MVRVLVLLIVLGIVAYLVTLLGLPEPFPKLIWAVMILCLIWEVLALGGFVTSAINTNRSPPP